MFEKLPEKVRIVEVGPRDGLQNEAEQIASEDKISLINMLSESGLGIIELTSFVHPKWTPQLADSEEVARSVIKKDGVEYTALIPNLRGLERAISTGLKEVAVFMSSSESHCKKNLNRSLDESLEIVENVVKEARKQGLKIRGYLSTVFGCPYEGYIDHQKITEITRKLLDFGIYQVSLGDTIGIANPRQVKEILTKIFSVIDSKEQIALHFHDTRGLGLANSLVGLEMGVTTFDSSLGGLGGCPYAPGATGNISTEDLVNMLQSMGVETGIKLDKLVEANNFMAKVLNRELNSKFTKTWNATRKVPI